MAVLADLVSRLQEAFRDADVSFPVVGAVLFGSAATGRATTQSDVDLLVVGENLPAERHRRHREIMDIKRLLADLPVEIVLLSPAEVRSNFANHNPLFLDIAEDGVVLLDRQGQLASAIEETRRYVRSRGIARTGGGWRFPVERGVPTYLSHVSNRDFAMAMLDDATRDGVIGVRLVGDGFYDKSVYHFQQAVEKAVKAMLISLGVFRKSHVVGEALRGAASEDVVSQEWRTRLLKVAEISESIEAEATLSRYPGIIDDALWLPSAEYELEDAEGARGKAEEALRVAHAFVDDWFTRPGSKTDETSGG